MKRLMPTGLPGPPSTKFDRRQLDEDGFAVVNFETIKFPKPAAQI